MKMAVSLAAEKDPGRYWKWGKQVLKQNKPSFLLLLKGR